MSALRRACARLLSLFRREALDHDFDEEAQLHLDLAVEDYVRRGTPEAEARRLARIKFGAIEATKDAHRDARGFPWLEGLFYDLRFALRGLRRDWAFSLAAITILALAIGLNVTVFTVMDAMLFRGYPIVKRNDRLVYLQERSPLRTNFLSFADVEEWRAQAHAFEGIGYVSSRSLAFRDGEGRPIDMSASTDFPLPGPAAIAKPAGAATQTAPSGLYLHGGHDDMPDPVSAPKRRVIDVSKDALALMCDALQALGDSYAIYGFSGYGRDNVEFHVAKDFADKLSAKTWGALAAMQPRRSTRMGAAIRHALGKLARETAGIKVLIIVSDGYPEDHDYGTDRTDREYGIQDTARALWEAERAGVTDFCVTIDPAGHDYLRRMCKETRYLVIDDVISLPHELAKIYRTLTAR